MAKIQRERHQELDLTFPRDVVQKWEKMVTDWNANPQAPNPYVEPIISEFPSIGNVRTIKPLISISRHIHDYPPD